MKRITWVECPNCKKLGDQKVVRSERNSKYIIIRRRECYECGHRWETIQYPEMTVSRQQAAYARCEWVSWCFCTLRRIFICSINKRSLYKNFILIVGFSINANFASSSTTRIIALDNTTSLFAWFFIKSMQNDFTCSMSLQAHTSLHRSSTANSVSGDSLLWIIFINPSSFIVVKKLLFYQETTVVRENLLLGHQVHLRFACRWLVKDPQLIACKLT